LELPLAKNKRLDFSFYRSYRAISTGGQPPQMFVRFRNPSPRPSAWSVETGVLVTIDSGADITLLPPQAAERLGVELESLKKETIGSIERGRGIPVYQRVRLRAFLCEDWIELPVRFYVQDQGSAVLGRAGAFEKLQIAFVDRDKVIYASPL
jgi:hypothetical protein